MQLFSSFYQNARARESLELLLLSAIATVIGVRVFLEATNYPSISGNGLHIAHVLWGGLLMMGALMMVVARMGMRTQRIVCLVGGVGFGLFIDELGKFITQDNDYFYKPAMVLIYLTFVALFIIMQRIGQTHKLSQAEYLLNALSLTEGLAAGKLERKDRDLALAYLQRADSRNPLVPKLRQALTEAEVSDDDTSSWLVGWNRKLKHAYRELMSSPNGPHLLEVIFKTKAVALIAFAVLGLMNSPAGKDDGGVQLVAGVLGSLVSAGFVWAGLRRGRDDRLGRFQLFSISMFIDTFVTQPIAFYQHQLLAIPRIVLIVVIYLGLQFMIRQEKLTTNKIK